LLQKAGVPTRYLGLHRIEVAVQELDRQRMTPPAPTRSKQPNEKQWFLFNKNIQLMTIASKFTFSYHIEGNTEERESKSR
jgi:hypothetical protein